VSYLSNYGRAQFFDPDYHFSILEVSSDCIDPDKQLGGEAKNAKKTYTEKIKSNINKSKF